ncbi:dna polymerase iii delta subunit [Lucifera butyrica]|uniref:Dna polymerase iii delta subunit n=1 Tax=Lucifera butyrica TaxID=1351585 RepID=A0A498R6S5_9FIRM|nr:DNA polymerase III subunit delta' [Lucifera butyrica]VBB06587.1 dna polymerase iii delta subunit [Lucifera butyrica]
MEWKNIIGHEERIATLRGMLAGGRIPHALLLAGPEGTGKMLVARTLAAAILCSAGQGEKPCGSCNDCRLSRQGAHPDLHIVEAEGSTIKIAQIRALQYEAGMSAHINPYRVCIIQDAERMTTEAQNSLLKLLEEPPSNFVFILVAAVFQKLLVTIRSRCFLLSFQPLPAAVLAEGLAARGVAPAQADLVSRLAGGRMGMALALLEPGGLELRDQAATLLEAVCRQESGLVWEQGPLWEKLGNQVLDLLQYLALLLRDILVILCGRNEKLVFNIDLLDFLMAQTKYWDEPRLMAALADVKKAQRALLANANTRLTGEALLIRLLDGAREGR